MIDWYTGQFLIWYVYVGTIHYCIPLDLSITHTCRRTAGSAEALQYESNSHTPTHLHIPTPPTHPTHPLNIHTHRAQLQCEYLVHTHTPHSPHTPHTLPIHTLTRGLWVQLKDCNVSLWQSHYSCHLLKEYQQHTSDILTNQRAAAQEMEELNY